MSTDSPFTAEQEARIVELVKANSTDDAETRAIVEEILGTDPQPDPEPSPFPMLIGCAEARDGSMFAPFEVHETVPNTYAGSTIYTTEDVPDRRDLDDRPFQGWCIYPFYLPSGVFEMHGWVRVRSKNRSANSAFRQVDGESAKAWHFPVNNGEWTWVSFGAKGEGVTYSLTPGEHIFRLGMRESGVEFDSILLHDRPGVPDDILLEDTFPNPDEEPALSGYGGDGYGGGEYGDASST